MIDLIDKHITAYKVKNKLSEQLRLAHSHKILSKLVEFCNVNYGVEVKIGAEVEFVAKFGNNNFTNTQLHHIYPFTLLNKFSCQLKQENQQGQWEVITPPLIPEELMNTLNEVRYVLSEAAKINDIEIITAPEFMDYTNSMHVSVSFTSKQLGESLQACNSLVDNSYVNNLASFMCNNISQTILAHAPNLEDYQRLKGSWQTPANLSWGINNRSALVRVVNDKNGLRFENRLPTINSHTEIVMIAMIYSLVQCYQNYMINILPLYGNSKDFMHSYDNLPRQLKEAKLMDKGENFLQDVMTSINQPSF